VQVFLSTEEDVAAVAASIRKLFQARRQVVNRPKRIPSRGVDVGMPKDLRQGGQIATGL